MKTVTITDWKKYPAKRDNVLLILRTIQNNNPQNYISDKQLIDVATYLEMSLAELEGVVSFYSFFSRVPRGKYILRLCDSSPCRIAGSLDLYQLLSDKLNIKDGEMSRDGLFSIEIVNCLGRCDKAPVIMINDKFYSNLTNIKLEDIINNIVEKERDGRI